MRTLILSTALALAAYGVAAAQDLKGSRDLAGYTQVGSCAQCSAKRRANGSVGG